MEYFLRSLLERNYQNRKIAIVENGTWAPSTAKTMKEIIEQMKNIKVCDTIVTIKTTMSEENKREMEKMVDELLQGENG